MPVAPYTKPKSSWWKYLLVFFAGFLTCVIVVGTSALIAMNAITVKQAAKWTLPAKYIDDIDNIISIDYQDLSLLEASEKLAHKKFETLGDINEVLPAVEHKLVPKLNEYLKKEIRFEYDWNEMKNKPFEKSTSGRPASEVDPNETLGTYLPRALKQGLLLKNFLLSEAQRGETNPDFNKLTFYFAYPIIKDAEGVESFDVEHPYSIYDVMNTDGFADKIIENVKEKVTIRGFLSEDQIKGNTILEFLADTSLNKLSDKIKNATIGDYLGIDKSQPKKEDTHAILYYLADVKVNEKDLSNALDSATVEDLLQPKEGDVLYELRGYTVKDLPNHTGELELGKVMTIADDDTPILVYMRDQHTIVNDVPSTIKGATMDKFFKIDEKSSNIMKYIANPDNGVTIDNLDTKINKAPLKDLLPETSGNKVINYLRTATYEDKSVDPAETKYYCLDNVGDAIDNATMADLVDISETNKVLNYLSTSKLKEIDNKLKQATLADLIDIDSSDPETPTILIALAGCTLYGDNGTTSIADKVKNLKFNEVYDDDDFIKIVDGKEVPKDSQIMYSLWVSSTPHGDFEISKLGEQLNKVKIVDAFADQIYEDITPAWKSTLSPAAQAYIDAHELKQRIKPSWWMLLTECGGDPSVEGSDEKYYAEHPEQKYLVLHKGMNYTLGNNVGDLVNNMGDHIRTDSIRDLLGNGYVSIESTTQEKLDHIMAGDPVARDDSWKDFNITTFITWITSKVSI